MTRTFPTRFIGVVASLCLFACLAFPQTTMTSTTLSVALNATDTTLSVASATGISAPSGTQQVRTILFADKEALAVLAVSGTNITVQRGYEGSRISSHASGATVYVGPPDYYFHYDPAGSCTSTAEVVLPRVVIPTGNVWTCTSSQWTLSSLAEGTTGLHVGAAETGVTAAEYGTARQHVTKLTFTNLAIGSSTGAAALGFGKLLYTLPAGAVVVRGAYMNVALTGSGAACDADTPDGGLGTVIGSGVVATLDGTATFENIMTGQTFNDLTATAELKTVSGQVLSIEAAAAHTVHFNLADTWAAACDVTATGTVVLDWVYLP
jgi:hypothetical protein